tara:strand:- start:908 stop:1483 length:576 start_codon:yes stop_codon:yes gene_type:complete
VHKYIGRGLIAFVLTSIAPLLSAHNQECLDLMDEGLRLSCFDAAHGFDESVVSSSWPENQLVNKQNPRLEKNTEDQSISASQNKALIDVIIQNKKQNRFWSRVSDRKRGAQQSEANNKSLTISLTVQQVVTLWPDDRKRYFLSNDQVWEQTRTKLVDIKAQDKVKIKKGVFSGYLLLAEGGASVPVKMVKQ